MNSFVQYKPVLRIETFAATRAHERTFVGVNTHVSYKILFLHKLFAAIRALVLPFVCMDQFMARKRALLFKAFAANWTFVRTFVSVDSLMFYKILLVREPFAAIYAFKHTFIGVRSFVHYKCVFVLVTFAAVWALEWSRIRVHSFRVFCEILLPYESFFADRALKWTFVCMNTFVFHEVPFPRKRLWALLARERTLLRMNALMVHKSFLSCAAFTTKFAQVGAFLVLQLLFP